jgi:hypothetical protein
MKRREIKREVQIVGEQSEEQPVSQDVKPIMPNISFDSWWLQVQNKHSFKSALKDAVKKHFEARGFMSSREFDKGLRDFGFNT